MVITYHGAQSFRVSFGDITLAFDPVSKSSKLKSQNFGSDIVLISLNHPDMNGAETAARGEREPFVIAGPGEYEIKDIFIRGFASKSGYAGAKAINTIYTVFLEGMTLCFLGALQDPELGKEAQEGIDEVDVLFVPVGNIGVLTSAQASKLAVSLEPKIIIPMHYGDIGEKDSLKKFLKEEGAEGTAPIEKLTLKKKDLEGKEGEVVVLSS